MDVSIQYSPYVPAAYQYPLQEVIPLHALGVGGKSFTEGVNYPMKGITRFFTGVFVDSYDASVKPLVLPHNGEFNLQYHLTIMNHGIVHVREPIFIDVFSPEMSIIPFGSRLADLIFVKLA